MPRRDATLIGFTAVLLWALLALLTVGSAPVPPFQLNILTFAIGGVAGLIWLAATGGLGQLRGIPWTVYVFGTLGLFGYHFLYFSALRMAPAAEAGLIAYLWPLLIVVFSGLLPGERLSSWHLWGAIFAFGGAALLVFDGLQSPELSALPGYGLAFLCALVWSGYSVQSRRMGTVPTAAVAVYCIATALLSLPAHLAFETSQWPDSLTGWLAILGLGLGPVGLAFFTWDIGVKQGDIQLLGTLSYAAPLLSTAALALAGVTPASPKIIVAALMIAVGAALASRAAARPVNSG